MRIPENQDIIWRIAVLIAEFSGRDIVDEVDYRLAEVIVHRLDLQEKN